MADPKDALPKAPDFGFGHEMLMNPGLSPKMVDGFMIDFFRVTTEATENLPAQNIINLHHSQTGVDCYVAVGKEDKKTDQELADAAKEVYRRLATESRRFKMLDSRKNESDKGQLKDIHTCLDRYSSAPDADALALIRLEFKQLSQQFDIPESLNQIDLAATWDWQIQQNFQKPADILFDIKPIEGFDPKDSGFTPIVMAPRTEQKTDY